MGGSSPSRPLLLLGYGNPGRCDDGLGPALVEQVEALGLRDVAIRVDYQLSIEHAELVARYPAVIFVDAARDAKEAFYLRRVVAAPHRGGSHHFAPGAVLALAEACFGATPEAYVLGVRAHDLESFHEGLSARGSADLERAVEALVDWIVGGVSAESDRATPRVGAR